MEKIQQLPLIKRDVPLFSYKQALYASFFKWHLYIDVVKNWKGLGLHYLLLTVMVFCIPLSVKMAYQFHVFFEQDVLRVIENIPTVQIKNGRLSVDQPIPYLIKNGQNQVVGMINPTSHDDYAMYQDPKLRLLMTQNAIYYRSVIIPFFNNIERIHAQPIPQGSYEVFNGKDFLNQHKLYYIGDMMIGIIYLLIVIIYWVLYTLFFLIFAIIAQFIAKLILKTYLTYIQSCRLLIVSATPSILLGVVLYTSNLLFKGSGLAIMILLAIYFSLATLTYRRNAKKLSRIML